MMHIFKIFLKLLIKERWAIFVNFLTIKDHRFGTGIALGENQYEQMDEEVTVKLSTMDGFFQYKNKITA